MSLSTDLTITLVTSLLAHNDLKFPNGSTKDFPLVFESAFTEVLIDLDNVDCTENHDGLPINLAVDKEVWRLLLSLVENGECKGPVTYLPHFIGEYGLYRQPVISVGLLLPTGQAADVVIYRKELYTYSEEKSKAGHSYQPLVDMSKFMYKL